MAIKLSKSTILKLRNNACCDSAFNLLFTFSKFGLTVPWRSMVYSDTILYNNSVY